VVEGMDDLWVDGPDPLADTPALDDPRGGFIGCPVWWLQRVASAVNTKNRLIVALYLWRRRAVCGHRNTFDVPNGELQVWGISRHTKYQTFDMLATAGLIKINPTRKTKWKGKLPTSITILVGKPRSKKR
jgi:hypothetical protein